MAAFYDPAANRSKIAAEWKRLGWSDLAIAGMLGRADRESSFNTIIQNKNDAGPGKHSVGLFQWNRSRKAGLLRYAKDNGLKWSDPVTQARYTDYEIRHGDERKTWERLSKAKNLTQAVNAAMLYTRPKGTIINGKLSPTTGLHYKETLASAKKFYGKTPAPTSESTPLDQIQSAWDPNKPQQSDWTPDEAPQSDAKIDFEAQAHVEQGLIDAQQNLSDNNEKLVTPNEGSFNPDLANGLSSLFPALNNNKPKVPAPPTITELQSLFRPRLEWASL